MHSLLSLRMESLPRSSTVGEDDLISLLVVDLLFGLVDKLFVFYKLDAGVRFARALIISLLDI